MNDFALGTRGWQESEKVYAGVAPIGVVLAGLAAAAPHEPMLTCETRTVTRLEVELRTNRLARAYAGRGVAHGELVAVALPNGIEFFEACLALWKLGATPLPVSPRLTAVERERILDLAGSRVVIGADIADGDGRLAIPAGYEPPPDTADTPLPSCVSPSIRALTSGGSTGQPKLIVSTRTSEVQPAALISPSRHFRPGQVQLVMGPLYHSMPITWALNGLLIGQHLVILPKFDTSVALWTIEHHKVDFFAAVPTMLIRMARAIDNNPGRYDLQSLEGVFHASSHCPAWAKARWIELVGADRVFEAYGGTESQGSTFITGTEWLEHQGSVGRSSVGELRVVDDEGNDVPVGDVGEIYLRLDPSQPSPYRYVGAEPRRLPDGGWESLGDMGFLDEDGYLYLADRRIDMIITGGANVYPAEVEAVISEHPHVVASAVVGLPDDDLGEVVHAVVQIVSDIDEAELREFVEQRLVRTKAPRSYRFVRDPLKTEADKLHRRAIAHHEIELLKAQHISLPAGGRDQSPPEGTP